MQQADSYVINLYCEIDGKRIRTHTIVAQPQRHVSATADGINYMVTERGAAVVMNQEAPYTGRISVAQSIEYGDDSHDVTIIDDNAFQQLLINFINDRMKKFPVEDFDWDAYENGESTGEIARRAYARL